MNNPKISVIIPAYNSGKYLGECLESVLGQTYRNIELIIIDDGSRDDSPDIAERAVRRAQSAGMPARLIMQKNSGVSVARNAGLAAATGDFVHFMDADDRLASPDFYARVADAVSRAAYADVAVVGVIDEKYGGRPVVNHKRARIVRRTQQKINAAQVARRPAVWNYVFRRELLIGRGMQFEPGRITSQDVMFSIPAVYHARAVATVPGAFYWYRRTPLGAMRDPAKEELRRRNKEIVWDRAVRFAVGHGFWLGPRRSLWKWMAMFAKAKICTRKRGESRI